MINLPIESSFSVSLFSGAKAHCKKDNLELSLRESTNHFIIDVEANNVSDQSKSESIVELVVNIATDIKI